MKKLLLLILALLIPLAACAAPTDAGQSPPPTQSVSASPTASPSPLPSPTPESTPAFVPDTDIPDIVWDNKKLVSSDSREDYFDKNNRYFLSSDDYGASDNYLYCQNKSGGSKQISKDYCSGFALYHGVLYFIEYSYIDEEVSKISNAIFSYDTATGERIKLKTLKNKIHDIFCYKGKLYFTYETSYDEEAEEQITDLYTLNPDGSGYKKIKDKVSSFCIYKNTIYYVISPFDEGNSLCKCTLDGKGSEVIIECADWLFKIYKDKLFYCEINELQEYNDYVMDLVTGQKHEIGETMTSTIAGQYVFFMPYDETDTDSYICAYDFESGKTYKCLKLSDPEHNLLTFWNQVELYKPDFDSGYYIVIKDGKASLEEISADSDGEDPVIDPGTTENKQPDDSTVIIADNEGYVYFGYSGGEWLTRSEAGSYCKGSMEFRKLSLSGLSGTVVSNGAVEDWEYGSYKVVNGETIYDENGCQLKLSEPADSWLCYISPDRLPEITPVSDYSQLQPIIQKLIDDKIGHGKLEAEINSAVEADIDKDGKPETIINASNESEDFEAREDEENCISYYIVCAIRQDGSFVFLDQSYGNYFEDEEQGGTVVGIFDADGDGSYEILFDWYGYESGDTRICEITDQKLVPVAGCGWAS